jgi:hypothetical protein
MQLGLVMLELGNMYRQLNRFYRWPLHENVLKNALKSFPKIVKHVQKKFQKKDKGIISCGHHSMENIRRGLHSRAKTG